MWCSAARRSSAAQRLTHDALGFLRLIGRIQRDRQGMGCDGIVGSECHETTIVRHRLALATQSGVCRHVQRRQIGIGLAAIAPGCRNLERRRRLARVQVVANQQKRGPRVGRGALDRTLQQGYGLGAATRDSATTPRGWSAWEPIGGRFRARAAAATPLGRGRPRPAWCRPAAAALPRNQDLRSPGIPIASALRRIDRIAAGR